MCYSERESHGEDPVDYWGQEGRMQEGTMAKNQYEHSVLLKAMTEHNKTSRPERRVWDGTTSPFMVDLANNSLGTGWGTLKGWADYEQSFVLLCFIT